MGGDDELGPFRGLFDQVRERGNYVGMQSQLRLFDADQGRGIGVKEDGEKVILLGGMDYLMTYNDFSKILRLLQNMKDRVTYAGAIMIIPYDPKLLEDKDLRRLRNEIEEQL